MSVIGALAASLVLALLGGAPAAAQMASASAEPANCPAPEVPLTADDVAAGMRDAVDSGLLWKATRDGHSSYLYGTIHVAKRPWIFPGPRVSAAFEASDTVALELDPTDPDIAVRLQRAIARRPDAPALPPALETRLRAQAVAACLGPSALSDLRPEMRAVTIEVMSARRLGLDPSYGIDVFLAQRSRQAGKLIRSLETPEAQAALLVSDDPAEAAHSVQTLVAELEDGSGLHTLERLAGDWRRGDLDDLASYEQWCGCMTTAEERADFAHLVDDRNPAMAAKIAQWHGDGHALFVAVGSLHLVGPNGLPALLQARGFDVVRVPFAAPPGAAAATTAR